ncbi:DegT/DnrJ/EryC1/StrS family aminotransferase [Lacisediminihabitans sp.]|uniref:DegT/DnrJ/EryC1/StrS family aminotransferase n=1 Tax=Lacisediminihabitans sp. TaxID=2787631 RepID=UPI00374DA9C7
MTTVPMLDLAWQHAQIAEEVRIGFDRVLAATSYITGPEVSAFEAAFAEFCTVDHVVGVGNGTDALELALRAAGVRPGDEVIVPANTFVATAEAVVRAGATVVFADCDENFLLDASKLAQHITPQTRAVIAVHLYGQTADVDAIRSVIGDDIALVEDAAQAQGAKYRGRRAGSLGDVAGTSFYPGKNLGAYGDAGAVITASSAIAQCVRALGNHGGIHKYEHLVVGTNSRLDSLQAVVLSAKLARLDDWNAERRRLAARYSRALSEVPGIVTPATVTGNDHVFHQYVVLVPQRDRVLTELAEAGIGVGVHYPQPVHLVPAFASPGHPRGSFPVAERLSEQILSLPIYPGLSEDHQDYVVARLVEAVAALAPLPDKATAGV